MVPPQRLKKVFTKIPRLGVWGGEGEAGGEGEGGGRGGAGGWVQSCSPHGRIIGILWMYIVYWRGVPQLGENYQVQLTAQLTAHFRSQHIPGVVPFLNSEQLPVDQKDEQPHGVI